MVNPLSKFFPVPRYLQIPAVGVDLSDRSVKYIEFKKIPGGFRLKRFGKKNIDKGLVENGIIKQKEALITQLKLLRQELKTDNIIASLPEEKGFIKVVKIPLVDGPQIRKSLEVQIEEIVPFSSEEVIFDFEVIGKDIDNKKLVIVISAFPKSVSEDYSFVFRGAGFMPVAFELENQSLLRSFSESGSDKAIMVVDFGKTRTSFLVGEEGFVKFSSTINIAGEGIDKLLARGLNIGVFEAERAKKKQLVVRNEEGGILDIILPIISVVKDEAARIMNYWVSHAEEQGFKNKEIDKIILCGGDSNLSGLTDYLSYELKKNVELGNAWMNVASFDDYIPEIECRESMMYATAIGLALRAIKIND